MAQQLTIQSNNFTLSKVNFTSIHQKRIVYAIIDSISPYLKNELEGIKNGKEANYEQGLFDIDRITYSAKNLEEHPQNYGKLREALDSLRGNNITIETDETVFGTSFILKYEWKKRNEQIILSIDRTLYSFLFDLSRGYTLLELKTALSLPSIYSMEIYELLAKWRGRPKFYISIKDLRFITNTTDKYPQVFDLKKRVLETAKRHLNQSLITDLRFDYKSKKEGRSVVGFWFYIIHTENSMESKTKIKNVSPRWVLSKKVIDEIKAIGIDLNGTITDFVLKFSLIHNQDDEKIIEKLRYFEEKGEQAVGIDSMPAYVVKSIKNEIENQKQKSNIKNTF